MAKHASQRVLRPSERRRRASRYVAALDGLRAFAVMAVIFYHMSLSWAPGGLMGVTVFFVISGYLINGLLVAEYDATKTISLPQFWLRRVRRIIPAVLLALAGTLVLCALISPTLFGKARNDLLPSLLFFNNWWQVFHNVSYFEAAAAPSPLTHYWSLAIEEQFYIVWPLLLLVLLKIRMPKKGVAAVIGVLAIASFAAMAYLYSPMADPSRIYYGTDTRAGSLLVGALLALMWPSTIFGLRRTQSDNGAARLAFNILGVAALVGLVAIIGFTNSYTSFPYRGGIALVSVLTALLITVLVVPNTWVARLMQLRPLVWIGKRSYGMYLWHYPIILATSRFTSTIEAPWWVRVSQIIVIFAISDLSYRFVETPIRSGALGMWWKARHSATPDAASGQPARKPALSRTAARGTVIACATLACAAAIALAVVPQSSSTSPQDMLNQAPADSAQAGAPSSALADINDRAASGNVVGGAAVDAGAANNGAAGGGAASAGAAADEHGPSASNGNSVPDGTASPSGSSAASDDSSESGSAAARSSSSDGAASASASSDGAVNDSPDGTSGASSDGASSASSSRGAASASQENPGKPSSAAASAEAGSKAAEADSASGSGVALAPQASQSAAASSTVSESSQASASSPAKASGASTQSASAKSATASSAAQSAEAASPAAQSADAASPAAPSADAASRGEAASGSSASVSPSSAGAGASNDASGSSAAALSASSAASAASDARQSGSTPSAASSASSEQPSSAAAASPTAPSSEPAASASAASVPSQAGSASGGASDSSAASVQAGAETSSSASSPQGASAGVSAESSSASASSTARSSAVAPSSDAAAPSGDSAAAASKSSNSAATEQAAGRKTDASASASASASSKTASSTTIFDKTAAAIAARVKGLSDEEHARIEEAQMGPVGRLVRELNETLEKKVEQNEQQEREDTYGELFETKHLNKSGALIFNPLLIGDSVAAGCENEFYRVFPYGHSDAQVNRNIWESPYDWYAENDQVGEYVVFCLGTNNAVIDEQVDEMLAHVGKGKKVLLVNVRCPRDWEAQTNEALAKASKKHDNVVALVDWYGASAGHDEYFYEDGIHVNAVGAEAYISLIQQAIRNSL